MSHPDKGYRIGAIYRSCVRYGMTKDTAIEHLAEAFKDEGLTPQSRYHQAQRLTEIWDNYGAITKANPTYSTGN